MQKLNFELGEVVQTRGIYEASQQSKQFEREIQAAFRLYMACNWGITCEEDKELNNDAVKKMMIGLLQSMQLARGIYLLLRSGTEVIQQ